MTGFNTVINSGSEASLKNVNSDHVITQGDVLLDDEMEMVCNDNLKLSKKRKSTGSESSSNKVRRAWTLSHEGDIYFELSHESSTLSLYTGGEIKKFFEQTKRQRLVIVEEHFHDLKLF